MLKNIVAFLFYRNNLVYKCDLPANVGGMADPDRIQALVDNFVNLRRENCRTLARLKALEAVIAQSVPSAERAAWYERVDRQYERCLQDLLEQFEKQSPGFAALFDDRGPDELRGLE